MTSGSLESGVAGKVEIGGLFSFGHEAARLRRAVVRVIVAGAMAWTDAEAIRRELADLPLGTTVVHGDSPGADALAGRVGGGRAGAASRAV
jgi:hypothetical protein